ncbi:hypothetical protein [Brevibacillus sp. NL20B1]|uniref:hypothetical protein n=1 Tax=Brevibacillus sp. NL20B1 TaxID=2829799 RepID=UPI0032C47AAF
MEDQNRELLDSLRVHLVDALRRHKRKPYLPVWGELFWALREIAKTGQRLGQDILIYPIQPIGTLLYRYQSDKFQVDIPDPGITISLTAEQLIDALINGSFAPIESFPVHKPPSLG